MHMNGKVNQGPVYDINVLFNRLSEKKLHPIIVRQCGHLNTYPGVVKENHIFLLFQMINVMAKRNPAHLQKSVLNFYKKNNNNNNM